MNQGQLPKSLGQNHRRSAEALRCRLCPAPRSLWLRFNTFEIDQGPSSPEAGKGPLPSLQLTLPPVTVEAEKNHVFLHTHLQLSGRPPWTTSRCHTRCSHHPPILQMRAWSLQQTLQVLRPHHPKPSEPSVHPPLPRLCILLLLTARPWNSWATCWSPESTALRSLGFTATSRPGRLFQ